MNLNLIGKTALVTAASGGIGSGVAEALAEAGVQVAISGRTRASLEMVAKTLASRTGGRPAIVVGDVSAKDGPAQIAAEALRALGGRIDIPVNNAGASRPITDEVDDAYWEESLTLNFMAARRLTDLVIPPMKAGRWGRIISISGALVAPKLNAAAPAKAALASWSRTLAFELGAYGITVNTIAPGRINTAGDDPRRRLLLQQQHEDREQLISKSFNFVPHPRSKRDGGQEPRGRQGFEPVRAA